ncbi:Uncharacterised protein [Yersinia intermedia]|nr:Uncharacterised protein [Yersinia intermedia]CNC01826.1 Uncharacterised protein [Yersinia intermedia]CNG77662.1 Uncharacterised protein [Yersinia intermedia]CQJ63350.1 Uncharacterised protein [Yersinia intermedia]CRE89225.1 Uncharacterised protein [Yersinia intermedia]
MPWLFQHSQHNWSGSMTNLLAGELERYALMPTKLGAE